MLQVINNGATDSPATKAEMPMTTGTLVKISGSVPAHRVAEVISSRRGCDKVQFMAP
ncbi:hypothetical protein D3C72_2260300 [compost metagenome]